MEVPQFAAGRFVDEIVFDAAQRLKQFIILQQPPLELFRLGVAQSSEQVIAKYGFADQDIVLYKEWRKWAKCFIFARGSRLRMPPIAPVADAFGCEARCSKCPEFQPVSHASSPFSPGRSTRAA